MKINLENNLNAQKNFISRLYKRQMFGKKFSDVLKIFKPKNTTTILIVLGLIVLAYLLFVYYSPMKMLNDEYMTTGEETTDAPAKTAEDVPSEAVLPTEQNVLSDYVGKSVDPSDLLPQDQNSQWATLNPVNQGNVAVPDLLQAGYHIGLDTIGQSLRNANLQLRSDPIISKSEVGPWNQSTIEPDLGRVPLEINSSGR